VSRFSAPRFSAWRAPELHGLPPLPATTREERSAWFKEIARNEELALAQVRSLGLEVSGVGELTECLLHPGRFEAKLTRGRNGEIVYRCSCEGQDRFFTLPELAASHATGERIELTRIQHPDHRMRLLARAGLLVLPEVPVVPLEPAEPAFLKPVYDGFHDLLRCRWAYAPRSPVPFSRTFAQTWCGLPRDHVDAAIARLRQRNYMRVVGEQPSGRFRPMNLYLPGDGPGPPPSGEAAA
jgi:hypothetical protein